MELNQLFTCYYAFQSSLSAFESCYWKLLLRPLLGPLLITNATLQHSEPSMNYVLWYETLESYHHWLVVPQTLLPCTVYKAGFLLSYHPLFFANATLQFKSSSAHHISKMELWEAIVSDLWFHKGLFCRFTHKRLDFFRLTLLIVTCF